MSAKLVIPNIKADLDPQILARIIGILKEQVKHDQPLGRLYELILLKEQLVKELSESIDNDRDKANMMYIDLTDRV